MGCLKKKGIWLDDPLDLALALRAPGEGSLIDSQKDVGGWPQYRTEKPLRDRDKDGMPDEWEEQYGLNLKDRKDSTQDADGDGYTNLEEFINGTNPTNRRGNRR